MKTIGERISIKETPTKTTVVISSKISSARESLLAAWLVCWILCLGYILYETFRPHSDDESVFLFVLAVFMAYYAYRIGRVLLWRRKGMEFLKIDNDELVYKRSMRKYGKAYRFHLDNISKVSIVTKEVGSFARVLENSFWVLGGERVSFVHAEANVRLGIQLNDKDAREFAKWLNKEIKSRREQNSVNQN